MNAVFCIMLLAGILAAAAQGKADAVQAALLSGGEEAVSLCLSLAGAYAFFGGLLGIMRESGMASALAAKLRRPLLRRALVQNIHRRAPANCGTERPQTVGAVWRNRIPQLKICIIQAFFRILGIPKQTVRYLPEPCTVNGFYARNGFFLALPKKRNQFCIVHILPPSVFFVLLLL